MASVIAGATSAAQVTASNVAAGGWQLTEPEAAEVDALAPIADPA